MSVITSYSDLCTKDLLLKSNFSEPSGGYDLQIKSLNHSMINNDLFSRFLEKEKHDFDKNELISIRNLLEDISKEFVEFKIACELTIERGVLLTLLNGNDRIHIQKFFNGEDDSYFYSLFMGSDYLFNGACEDLDQLISQIKIDYSSVFMASDSQYFANIENNVVTVGTSETFQYGLNAYEIPR